MNNKLNNYLERIKGKKILIQGLGLNGGGVGVAKFFLENGIPVTITDLKTEKDLAKSIDELSLYKDKITYVLGEHRDYDFLNADIVIKGPGVNPNTKYILLAKNNKAEITSDIAIFCEIAPCPIYAVTGSKGKSTTVSIIHSIFKAKSDNTFMGGNITISPLTFYKKLTKDSLVILELSSWQLRDLKGFNFNFHGAVITNLLNDHQNYYNNDMLAYLNDKAIITDNQNKEDFLIIPDDDKYINPSNIKTSAILHNFSINNSNASFYIKNNKAFYNNEELFDTAIIKLKGTHNIENCLIAAGFCYLAGIEKKYIIRGISEFEGTPYRIEFIKEWHGIKFYNDTTATIPDAMCHSIKAFDEPVILIAGGNDKNLNFSIIEEVMKLPKKILLLSGDGTNKMKEYIHREDVIESNSLEVLFNNAINLAIQGDIILLSPGCTSFGLFQNEFHRGDVFNELVKNLNN